MKKFEFNQEHVDHVLKNTKAEKCLVTADGQIFEMKSLNACKDYCAKKQIEYAEANSKGLIVDKKDEDSKEDTKTKVVELPLNKKTKAELTAIAIDLGIEELDGKTNPQLVEMIETAQKEKAAAEASAQ